MDRMAIAGAHSVGNRKLFLMAQYRSVDVSPDQSDQLPHFQHQHDTIRCICPCTPPHREFTYADLGPAHGSTPNAQCRLGAQLNSSYFKSTCAFAVSLGWAHIVATENVESAASRARISACIARWEAEHKKRPRGFVPYRTLE